MEIKNLGEVIKFNTNFRTAINLYLSLNKEEKISNYIPTKSSVNLMEDYIQSILCNKEHASILIGPYGKGKSHLLLVLLAVLSLERTRQNEKVVKNLQKKIKNIEDVGNKIANDIEKVWKQDRYLPVVINDTNGDLNQAFLSALSDALKRVNIDNLSPDTFFSEALLRIDEWHDQYPNTLELFSKELEGKQYSLPTIKADLRKFSSTALDIFKEIYPKITSGSKFNPLAVSDVIPLYKSVSEKLVEEYNFSGIYIVFDEFSKFIEGLDGKANGHTMKLLQDMCELASESSDARIYITMVAHKSIKEYGKNLSSEIVNGFVGIEGRIIEKYFVTSSKNNYELIRSAIVKDEHKIKEIPQITHLLNKENLRKYYELPVFRGRFSEADFANIVFKGCFPLNPIASYLLLNISEKVAQNERTLFTFISNDEPHSMARFISGQVDSNGWSINSDLIYDYFSGLFKKDVSNELIHSLWLGAEHAISKCDLPEQIKIIKSLATIMIVNKSDEIPANEKYLRLASGVPDSDKIISDLVEKQLIYRKSATGSYVFKTKAGSELKAEMKKQRAIKEDSKVNYSKALQTITGKYFVVPRKYNTQNQMTRYFTHEFMNVESFLSINSAEVFFNSKNVADGKIISLYGFSTINQEKVEAHFRKLNCNILILVLPSDILRGAKTLKDYEILEEVRLNYTFIDNNEIIKKEIPLLEEDIIKEIEAEYEAIYHNDSTKVLLLRNGQLLARAFDREEQTVGECCEYIYSKTPRINNEIINRTLIPTAQTKKARKNIVEALLKHQDDEVFYCGTNQEATIFRSLFKRTGVLDGAADEHLAEILLLMNQFIDSCCDSKKNMSEIINQITVAPYGMRLGVIPVFFAYVLSSRKEDLVVYFADMEVQIDADIVINMCETPDTYALFLSKEDHLKEKYIDNLNRLYDVDENRALSENRIKNIVICMQRWFRALPQIARNISWLQEYGDDEKLISNMKSLKKILQKVEVNSYEILFVDLVEKFDATSYQEAFEVLKLCKEGFDSCFDKAVNHTIVSIYDVFGGKRRIDLYHVLKEWHEKQSDFSKKGLHSGRITSFMTCIENLDVNTDSENGIVAQKIVKAISNTYLENWIDDAFQEFVTALTNTKFEIEHIREEKVDGKLHLSFVGSKGNLIEHYYEIVDEGTGTILRNIIEDTLEEYNDISVNDRVSILLEMIEKIIGE